MKNLLHYIIFTSTLAFYASASIHYRIGNDPNLYGNLSQDQLNGSLADEACGPVAVTNSLHYLENKYPSVYGNKLTNGDLKKTATELAELMGTEVAGTTDWDDLIWYKYCYIEKCMPGKTVYKAKYKPGDEDWSIWDDIDNKISRPDWVVPIAPNGKDLVYELNYSRDIEIELAFPDGRQHYLTLISIDWVDENRDGVIDGSENATFVYIDPKNGKISSARIWKGRTGLLETDYGGDFETTYVVLMVSEGIPEPASLLLLSLGGLMIRYRK